MAKLKILLYRLKSTDFNSLEYNKFSDKSKSQIVDILRPISPTDKILVNDHKILN